MNQRKQVIFTIFQLRYKENKSYKHPQIKSENIKEHHNVVVMMFFFWFLNFLIHEYTTLVIYRFDMSIYKFAFLS